MKLEKAQRNEIYEAIVAGGLDPSECRLRRRRSLFSGYSFLEHQLSQSYLKIKHQSAAPNTATGDFTKRYKMIDVVSSGPRNTGIGEWDKILEWVLEWAEKVLIPDLWTDFRQIKTSLGESLGAESDNTEFTLDEQRQIETQLNEIKRQVREKFAPPSEQMKRIEEKLDEVVEASKRMGRKDWLIFFLGSITALIITATVAAGVGEHIFTMFMHALGHLFTGGSEPPQIPPGSLA